MEFIDKKTMNEEEIKKKCESWGIDLDTIEGDYAEAYQHLSRKWNEVEIDNIF